MTPTPIPRPHQAPDAAARVHRVVVILLQLVMATELVLLARDGQWVTAVLVGLIMLITLAPLVFKERLPVVIPPEFQLLAVLFVFASLFLGEVRSFYQRFWWWDMALHTVSGLLLGILGFLLVFVLNENRRVNFQLQPRFVALFAFVFAVAVGALWEIFEFAMDQLIGTNMQKPMFGDPSGLTDTMWDLIVDTLGALVISVLGWWYLRRGQRSFIEAWIGKFIENNPRMFPY